MVPRRLLLSTAAALWAMLGVSAASSAAPSSGFHQPSNCTERLYDPTGQLTKDPNLPTLRHDIDALSDQGAIVRVRVYDRLPKGGLDAQEKVTEHACRSWLEQGKQRLPSLLVVSVATQARRTGIYYGSKYSSALDDSWKNIQRHKMNPKFQAGEYAAGLDAGIRAISHTIKADAKRRSSLGTGFWIAVGLVIAIPVAVIAFVVLNIVRGSVLGGGWRGSGGGISGSNDHLGGLSAGSDFSSGGSGFSGGGGGDGGGGSTGW